jgi:hypothetical protein
MKKKFSKKKGAYPSPREHVEQSEGWVPGWNVTVSNFNGVHHRS